MKKERYDITTPIVKRIASAFMAAVLAAGMLSAQELEAFAALAESSAQIQLPSVPSDLPEQFGDVLQTDSGEKQAATYTEGDFTYTVDDGKATFLDADGNLISGTMYEAEELITAPALPKNCIGWYAVGDETKTLIGDFTRIKC